MSFHLGNRREIDEQSVDVEKLRGRNCLARVEGLRVEKEIVTTVQVWENRIQLLPSPFGVLCQHRCSRRPEQLGRPHLCNR